MNTTDEKKRRQFLDLVRALANLRDVQYGDNQSESLVERALLIPTVNLPSNLLRAAAIFVDFRFGFRPKEDSFGPPAWVTSLKQLPENERGSLGCSNFREIEAAEEGDSVILLHDHPASGLMAGAAGVIRQVDQSEISGADDEILVEFGEPQMSSTISTMLARRCFRTPRPGDLLEAFIT